MRSVYLWRAGLVGLIVVIAAAAFFFSQERAGEFRYPLSVREFLAREEGSSDRVSVSGWLDPESVVETTGTLTFNLFAEQETDAGHVVVTADAGAARLPYYVTEVIVSGRADEHGVFECEEIVVRDREGPGRYEAATADAPVRLRRLSLQSKEAQLANILGHDVEVELVEEWLGIAVAPSSSIEVYRDGEGTLWIWSLPMGTWVGTLPQSSDQVPGRVYPGEASAEECLARADALAEEHYAGDKTAFDHLYRAWIRRVDEHDGNRNEAIVSYDATYQRYLEGIMMPDLVSVTVYARSGGSDFVGIRLSDEVTFTIEPKMTAHTADRLARAGLGTGAEDTPPLPATARLAGAELRVWDDRLLWVLCYDTDQPDGSATIPTGSILSASVDAITGEVIGASK